MTCPVCGKVELPEGVSVCETCALGKTTSEVATAPEVAREEHSNRRIVRKRLKVLRSSVDEPTENEVRLRWLEHYVESVSDVLLLLQKTKQENPLHARIYTELVRRISEPTDYNTTILKLQYLDEKDTAAIDKALAGYDTYIKEHSIEIEKQWFGWHQITLSVRAGTHAKAAAAAYMAGVSIRARHWRSVRQIVPKDSPLYIRACTELEKLREAQVPRKPRVRPHIVYQEKPSAPEPEKYPEEALPTEKAVAESEWPSAGKTRDLFEKIAAARGLTVEKMAQSLRGFINRRYSLSLQAIGSEESLLNRNYSGLIVKESSFIFTISIERGKLPLHARFFLTFTTAIQSGQPVVVCRWG